MKALLEFPYRLVSPALGDRHAGKQFRSASSSASRCLGQWERLDSTAPGVSVQSMVFMGHHRCRKFSLFYLCHSALDMEKYLLSSTPAVLLFVAGNWRETTSLTKDYLVQGGDGFVRDSPFLAAAGGWVLSLFKIKRTINHKKPMSVELCFNFKDRNRSAGVSPSLV